MSAVKETVADDKPGFWTTFWEELFFAPRKVWAGMAAAWLVALILNLSIGAEPVAQMAKQPVEPTPEAMQMVQEQQRLREKLLGVGVAAVELSPADRPRDGLKPRSERCEDFAVV